MERIAPFRRALEEGRRNASMNAMLRAKREALGWLLESKFSPLPEALASTLEELIDIDELNRLFKRALDAQTLEELDFKNSS